MNSNNNITLDNNDRNSTIKLLKNFKCFKHFMSCVFIYDFVYKIQLQNPNCEQFSDSK